MEKSRRWTFSSAARRIFRFALDLLRRITQGVDESWTYSGGGGGGGGGGGVCVCVCVCVNL